MQTYLFLFKNNNNRRKIKKNGYFLVIQNIVVNLQHVFHRIKFIKRGMQRHPIFRLSGERGLSRYFIGNFLNE